MPIRSEQIGYPICDTDIWIKVCKVDNVNLIYQRFSNIFISDAVGFELNQKKNDYPSEFRKPLEMFRNEIKKENVIIMHLSNGAMFNEKEKKFVLKKFNEHGIFYDEKKKQFICRKKNLGEMVSAIYAAVHRLPVILSDDEGCNSFVNNNYKFLQVINFRGLVESYGYSRGKIEQCIRLANSSPKTDIDSGRSLNILKNKLKKSS